jgi:signal recognition particle subunit SRP54
LFDSLQEKFQTIFKKLRGRGRLSEKEIDETLREVRIALLEADVNFKVVKDFLSSIKDRALTTEVLKHLNPSQQVIKIVHEELVKLMGNTQSEISMSPKSPTILMLVGLQGCGKTTTCAKLANIYKNKGLSPLLVAADVYRPAAIDQLAKLGKDLNIPVYVPTFSKNPPKICSKAVKQAIDSGNNIVIIDTAGRLHIDDKLMKELIEIKKQVNPTEILFVADAMTGQDAVNVAKGFNDTLHIDGIILTKLDGDARGGAALSIKHITEKPIKFVGIGEKIDQLEQFHPERMASRILGMGDILSLIEKAEKAFSEEQAKKLEMKIREDSFSLEDFKEQLVQLQNMGPLDQLLSMFPGMGNLKSISKHGLPEKELKKIEAMINSMTNKERQDYTIINGSRRKRIAAGSGATVQDLNRLLKQFVQMKKMMKQFKKGPPKHLMQLINKSGGF